MLYFADPMCSWCWGFSPTLEKLKNHYENKIKIALVLGGLQPGTKTGLDPAQRANILHHWKDVEKMTGQPFKTDGALPPGFIYDTEPSARAVLTIAEIRPQSLLEYLKSVQRAFYAEGRDITREDVLLELAEMHGAGRIEFVSMFNSPEIIKKTRMQFARARQYLIQTLPSLVIQGEGKGIHHLMEGHKSYEDLVEEIDRWLAI